MTMHEELAGVRRFRDNPFAITKAVDFSDSEIDAMWVDWPAPGGFAELMNVTSPMCRIVLGGKGTGRTHVMRHFSAPVQAIRGGGDPISQVREDGVLGIYVHCSGLNSSRFRGRGVDTDAWEAIFAQYIDVWLAQATLDAFDTVSAGYHRTPTVEETITREVRGLLHTGPENADVSIASLKEDLFGIQRRIDVSVNNAALNPKAGLDLTIHSSRGELVFGVPAALQRHYTPLRDVMCLYLIDEFENFAEPQQKYVNSLVREKKLGTSFIIGVRTYGLKTLKTLSGDEENKRGSEYEEIRPDKKYTGADREKFRDFCKRVVSRRLSRAGVVWDTGPDKLDDHLREFFDSPPDNYEQKLIVDRYKPDRRPYHVRLERQLSALASDRREMRIVPSDVQRILNATRLPNQPLLEKVNIFLIYRAWSDGEDLAEVAEDMARMRPSPESTGTLLPNPAQQSILNHFTTDLKAQLWHDMRGRQGYAGIDQFIDMSDGLPRNLLVILKNIYRWALFNGESPFHGTKISLESQRQGVLEAANWFFADARPLGADGEHVHAAINRLGDMFRQFRFSEKPVESSLASFSADLTSCSTRANEIVQIAEHWTLLIRADRDQKQRNTGLNEPKFHLNRLLSPRWDLPIARRGAVSLNSDEVNAIFDPDKSDQFASVLNRRLERMRPPFARTPSQNTYQHTLDLDRQEGE